ncbi:hypothetical protein [Nannocystis punicea]|uniref:Uncharacterized protein n=1 Tax=Nannocystis punicea TaxID=2995304 RepID=A0ABY7HJQ5_9BACT|nr:hypothetical protein [Nannocystis poenicansa]WAS99265.1 hypothetical protein O0S08_24315 [Nannocystis poenicansa]
MHSPSLCALLLAVAAVAPACVLSPEFVGATLTEAASNGTAASATTVVEEGASVSSTTAVESVTTGTPTTSATSGVPAAGAYGSFCELAGITFVPESTVITPQPECDGGICLVVSDDGPLACDFDFECAEEAEGSVCAPSRGFCTLSPAFLEANTRCTQTCELDEDCPDLPGCATGFRCATITFLGPLCCQKVCACKDHLYDLQADDADAYCAIAADEACS